MFEYKATVTNVVDGDTFDVSIDLGFGIYFNTRIRLAGVDTPEIHGVKKGSEEYKRGMDAIAYVYSWLSDHGWEVLLKTHKDRTGKYGRYLAYVFPLDAEDPSVTLNSDLIEDGHATFY